MSMFLFIGDMLVSAFMITVVVWISLSASREKMQAASRIPLEDESTHG